MLNLGTQSVQTCNGINRRSLLRLGALSLFGMSLPRVLEAQAQQPATPRRDLNCILLWMGGGASNIDTFDMKPDAPREIRGEFAPIRSNVPGIDVCEHLPLMSRQMDKVCLLRSVTHTESGDHVAACHYMLTGYPQRPDPTGQPANSVVYPAYGSVVSRERGWRGAVPPYVVVAGKAAPYTGAGYMGSTYNPLTVRADPNEAGFSVEDVTISERVGTARTERRRAMLTELDSWRRLHDQPGVIGERNQFYQQAYNLISSPAVANAFRIDQEPAAVRERYGRNRFGQAALLSRRLIEAGVRFVSVETHWWDTHQNNFVDLRGSRLPNLDLFYSALLEDLDQRGLLSNTLVIWMGEFGRTPTINGQAGRDHWAPANVIGLSGAGIRMGTVVGATDRQCVRPHGTAHSTHDFAATIYQLLGIDATREYRGPDGRPHLLNYHGRPIAGVLS